MKTKDLKAYQLSYKAALEIHRTSLNFPKIEQFGLADQIRRSSRSIPANLAEGLNTYRSNSEELQFLRVALGSCEETLVWLDFAKDLVYIDPELHSEFRDRYDEIGKLLFGLIKLRQ